MCYQDHDGLKKRTQDPRQGSKTTRENDESYENYKDKMNVNYRQFLCVNINIFSFFSED